MVFPHNYNVTNRNGNGLGRAGLTRKNPDYLHFGSSWVRLFLSLHNDFSLTFNIWLSLSDFALFVNDVTQNYFVLELLYVHNFSIKKKFISYTNKNTQFHNLTTTTTIIIIIIHNFCPMYCTQNYSFIHTHTHTHTHIYIYMYVCMYICIKCVCVCVCMYVCMYVVFTTQNFIIFIIFFFNFGSGQVGSMKARTLTRI